MKPIHFANVIVGVLTASQVAGAAVVAFDDFESIAAGGALHDANGGSGWTGAWAAKPGVGVQNAEIAGGGNRSAEITGATNDALAALRSFTAQTGTVYFSLHLNVAAGLNTNDFLHFYLTNSATNDKSGGIGLLSTTTNFIGTRVGDGNGGATVSSNTTAAEDTTYFLVGKLSKVNNVAYNRMDLYVNPASAIEPGTADATQTTVTGVAQVQYFGVRSYQFDDGDRYQFDNVRIGTTFADVAVPEPGMLGVMGLAAVALLRRSRA